MRVASQLAFFALTGLLATTGCDTAPARDARAPVAAPVATAPRIPSRLPQLQLPSAAPSDAPVAFGDVSDLGDASAFAATDLADHAEGQAIAVARGDHGQIELVTRRGDATTSETLNAPDATRRRVSAVAIALDAKGQPEIVVAWTLPDGRGETVHFARSGNAGGWTKTQVAPFAAAQIAFNAKSPRGSEVVIVDAVATSLHAAFVAGVWQPLPLPAAAFRDAGALAVAVAVDAEGRSHFALGADYYGDRGDGYVYWPSDWPKNDQPSGGVAIVFDPADPARHPQIIHAQRELVAADVYATSLYRTVIGPDSAATTLWSQATAIADYQQDFAPDAGQLAARIDADGYLHTVAAVRNDRAHATTWGLVYDVDRGGAHHADLDVQATGAVAFAGDDAILVSDHGQLIAAARTSTFTAVEPAAIVEPPSVGAVVACDAGATGDGPQVIRHMSDLSAVSFAAGADGDEIAALEWDLGRGAVRATRGDAIGWDTREVTPWQLDTMSAGRSRAIIGADGGMQVVWPEGHAVAFWRQIDGHWLGGRAPIADITDAPDLGAWDGATWVSGIRQSSGASTDEANDRTGELVATRFDGHTWSEPDVLSRRATTQTLVSGADRPRIVFGERRADATTTLTLATYGDRGWTRRDLAFDAQDVSDLRAVQSGDAIYALVALDGASPAVVALRIALAGDDRTSAVIGTWPAASGHVVGARALFAGPLAKGAAVFAWDDGHALEGARIGTDGAIVRDTLALASSASLWSGFATRQGRLVAVAQDGQSVDFIGQACAH